MNSTLAKEDAEAENQEGKVMRVVVGVLSSKMRGVQNNPKGDDLWWGGCFPLVWNFFQKFLFLLDSSKSINIDSTSWNQAQEHYLY